jgi:beta-glucosidase/6-phospho-beta-glucosidase/beta-galactosidase|tara:strand:+ start:1146 stop:1289 length:144 start_codon:yes stop_codon:yes gene_type:complete
MKFGLYEVNFNNQKRKPRNGSLAFKRAIDQTGVDEQDYIVSIGDTRS